LLDSNDPLSFVSFAVCDDGLEGAAGFLGGLFPAWGLLLAAALRASSSALRLASYSRLRLSSASLISSAIMRSSSASRLAASFCCCFRYESREERSSCSCFTSTSVADCCAISMSCASESRFSCRSCVVFSCDRRSLFFSSSEMSVLRRLLLSTSHAAKLCM